MTVTRPLFVALALAACGGTALTAAVAANVDRNYSVGQFDEVATAGPNLVVIRVGGAPSVTAEGPLETLDKMEVVVERGGLQIRPRRQFRDHFDWRGLKPATFTVTVPRLTAATLAGSGAMKIDRIDGDRFAASLAGSGSMDIGALRVGKVALNAAGSGTLTVRGSAGRAEVSVAGSGSVRAHGLASRTASVSIAGSGDAELTASDTANVSLIGSGIADIAGGAKCRVSRIGSGRARCG